MDLMALIVLALLRLLPQSAQDQMFKDGDVPSVTQPAPSSVQGDGTAGLDPNG